MSRQAAISSSARRFRPRATASMRWRVGRVQRLGLVHQPRGQALRQRAHRPQQRVQGHAQRLAALEHAGWGAVQSASSPWGLSVPLARARTSARTSTRNRSMGPLGRALVRPGASQPSPGRIAGGLQDRLQGLARRLDRRRPDPRPGASGRAAGRNPPPISQRRSSAVSSPVRWAAKALSAASNR